MFDFDERYKGGEKSVLVSVEFSEESGCEDLEELRMLALSAGAEIVGVLTCARKVPDSRFFIGSGKTEELAVLVADKQAEIVIFNHDLSPSQERNLETFVKCKVISRTSLILDIFAQRARTNEGKLQVELAQLRYLQTRLVRGWTHLERQRGGIGMRGPGETQLESDRRLLKERIIDLKNQLLEVEKQREQNGSSRKKNSLPIVSLVGYTNAGKSTLFNVLTNSEVYAADQLFATLDPTLRTLKLPNIGKVIFADTVGFIRHLPHDLVAAFKATLRETREADIQLHVVDSSDDRMSENMNSVASVLTQIDADDIPQIKVYNKIDKIHGVEPHIEYDCYGFPVGVSISAKTGKGIDLLLKAISEVLSEGVIEITIKLPLDSNSGSLVSQLYEIGAVCESNYAQDGSNILRLKQKKITLAQLNKRHKGILEKYCVKPKDFTFEECEY
ncbi:MAG: ribosome rescue GTPase HflX [Succinivibrionaceae bacterium]